MLSISSRCLNNLPYPEDPYASRRASCAIIASATPRVLITGSCRRSSWRTDLRMIVRYQRRGPRSWMEPSYPCVPRDSIGF